MNILQINVLRGANYWSQEQKKLIVLKIDLEDLELSSSKDNDFSKQLQKFLPTLYSHPCTPCYKGKEGSFFKHLKKGISFSHVIGHIAVELQNLVGMNTFLQNIVSSKQKGIYHIIFSYEVENAGILAAETAVKITECLSKGRKYIDLQKDIEKINEIYQEEKLGPSTLSIIQEVEKRHICWAKLKSHPFIILGQGVYQKKIWATVTSQTPSMGVETASDKNLTKLILEKHLVPTPQGHLISTKEELDEILTTIAFPLVIKPYNGNHGKGVTCDIQNKEQAIVAYELAKGFSTKAIVEPFIEGEDYRILVVSNKVVAVAKRTPAHVIGTGKKTIKELINEVNQDPDRGEGHDNFLTNVSVDDITRNILQEKKFTLDTILEKDYVLNLKHSANISSGGTAEDVTEKIHPYNIKLAQKIAKIIGLDICGIDVIAQNIEKPMRKNNSAIIEVNAAPGLRMHLKPSKGKSRDVASAIVDSLFPANKPFRVPIIAVTGTNGKTTVVRLIAHIAKWCHLNVGFTTTEGIYIDNDMMYEGDSSGPISAQVVLQDPTINFAVLECARGGILRSGLGFEHCNISIITNITEDHLGLNDIHTIQELAKVKAVVAHSTYKDGYAILNAEDDLVYELKSKLDCNIALFGLQDNKRIKQHCQNGGLAAFIDKEWIIVCEGKEKEKIAPLKEVPLSFNGKAECMVKNLLAAVLAGRISGFSNKNISQAITNFAPSAENTPGRMNIYKFKDFQLMLDYAHNEGGFLEIKKFLSSLNCAKKIGIISATGDRKSSDIQKLGKLSAQMFDEIIIKHNKDGRGSSNEHLTTLLLEGIHSEHSRSKVKVISSEFEALNYALDNATPNSFIFYAADDVFSALKHINNELRNRNSLN